MRSGHRLRWRSGVVAAATAGALLPGNAALAASTHYVDDCAVSGTGTTPGDPFCSIQEAIDAAISGDTLVVADGTYAEDLVLAKSLTMLGAQAGVDARGRTAAAESTITQTVRGLELKAGSAGSTVDGFSFAGGGRAIESTSGPLNGLAVLNNRFAVASAGSALFLNDAGTDVTIDQNVMDGGGVSSTLIHLDTDPFHGLWLTDNDILDSGGTGFFVDGNRNVGASAGRDPKFDGNTFVGNVTGANLGRMAVADALISGNAFRNSGFDGLQGGPRDSTITENLFVGNGRSGLALTGFGGSGDAARGAQGNTITDNYFTTNAVEALFFSSGQFPGTISTNTASGNCIAGNTAGATYAGTETIDVEDNWWGAADGPSGAYGGSGDSVSSTNLDADPWLTAPPAVCPDEAGPVTSDTTATPNPVAVSQAFDVTATVDDSTTGGSDIASAEWQLDGGTWMALDAADGSFDEVAEGVEGSGAAPADPGLYDLCVRGTDEPGNTGDPECVTLVVYYPSAGFVTGGGWFTSPPGAATVAVWQQDFSSGTAGWGDASSGWYGTITNNGDGTAQVEGDADSAPFSRFDGYRSVWPGTWIAEIDVYLDPAWAAGTGFDYSVAATGSDGAHQRDFIFHVTKDTSTGDLLVAGSNNTNFAPREDLETVDHHVVTTAGWYTLQHVFRDAGGYLAVDLNLLDAGGTVLFTETRSNPADTVPGEVGGNRYAWFTFINVAGGVQIDDHELFLDSPAGKATFGFVSKYKKGATAPDGQTEFQFKAGDINLHSTSYQWLVVTGSDYAKFKGVATVNGNPGYHFQIWAGDGSPDTFRIKIWTEDGGTETVIYDNGMDQPIESGQIVVHTGKRK